LPKGLVRDDDVEPAQVVLPPVHRSLEGPEKTEKGEKKRGERRGGSRRGLIHVLDRPAYSTRLMSSPSAPGAPRENAERREGRGKQ